MKDGSTAIMPQTRFDGTVALWFTSHYPLWDRDWKNIEEFNGPLHPLAGYYRSDDVAVLRQQLHDMRRAGVDMIVYDCMSTSKATTLEELPNETPLQLLLEELAHQEGESRKLKLCMWLERYADNPSIEHYRFALDYIRKHMAEQDYYYRYQGRPLVVTYLNGLPGANRAIDEVEYENTFFTLRRIRAYDSDVWSYIEKYPQRLNRNWMSACPAIDPYLEMAYQAAHMGGPQPPDYRKIREEADKHRADRENGAYYRKQLGRARQANPEIVFISGWNDWQYGCQIEPAREYGHLYVDLTAEILGRWDETEPYRKEQES